MRIAFRHIQADDLSVLRSWFTDPELARRVGCPTDRWFAHVNGEASRCWLAFDAAGTMVAQIQVDQEPGEPGYILLALNPPLRGRGLGVAVLRAFVDGPGSAYPVLEGRIEPDNVASLACARRCGFREITEPDEDGLIRVVRQAS